MSLKTWCNEFWEHEPKYYKGLIVLITIIMAIIEISIMILDPFLVMEMP